MRTGWMLGAVILSVGWAACSDSDEEAVDDSPGSTVDETGGPPAPQIRCQLDDYLDTVVSFCRTQNPASPAPGELGAPCVEDEQCASDFCLEPFGSAGHCSLLCPSGNECPAGYSCQDTGTVGPGCYESLCIYPAGSASECVGLMSTEIEEACQTERNCVARLESWLGCLSNTPSRLCTNSEADEACGIERGLLQECCPLCDTF